MLFVCSCVEERRGVGGHRGCEIHPGETCAFRHS